jgi:hypothetical protein
MTTFVKSANTSVPVGRSRDELERVLRRYGANAFASACDFDAGKVSITFRVPDRPGEVANVPVRLEASFRAVYDQLYGQPFTTKWDDKKGRIKEFNPKGYDATKLAQAERIAWRHLVLWVDAACTAASVGIQTMREAFFAHTLIRDEHGKIGRLGDFVKTLEASGQLLLPSGDDAGGPHPQ